MTPSSEGVKEMYCSVRTHYGLNFYHDELTEVGFDAKELWDILQHTRSKKRKFLVMWDEENVPHFGSPQTNGTVPFVNTYSSFYYNLLTWVYHKTLIKTYRVVHTGPRLTLCFEHSQNNVNPKLTFPNYDFTGFSNHMKTREDGSTLVSWKVNILKESVPETLLPSSVVRPTF